MHTMYFSTLQQSTELPLISMKRLNTMLYVHITEKPIRLLMFMVHEHIISRGPIWQRLQLRDPVKNIQGTETQYYSNCIYKRTSMSGYAG